MPSKMFKCAIQVLLFYVSSFLSCCTPGAVGRSANVSGKYPSLTSPAIYFSQHSDYTGSRHFLGNDQWGHGEHSLCVRDVS